MQSKKKIRVLLCKPPLDMHSRGILVVARALRDAGMEVIYLEASPQVGATEIAETAVQEAVDVIGLSILSGSPVIVVSKIMRLLNEKGISDVPLIIGGIVPKDEMEELKKIGVKAIFPPGTFMKAIVQGIQRLCGG